MAVRRFICHWGTSCPQIGLCPLGPGVGTGLTSGGAGRESPVQAGARRVTVSTWRRKDARGGCSARGTRLDPHALACPDSGTIGAPLLHFLRCTARAELPWAMTSSKPGMTSGTCPAWATTSHPRPRPPLAPAAAICAYPSPPPPSGAAPCRSGCTSDPLESGLARPAPPKPRPRPRPGPSHAPGRPACAPPGSETHARTACDRRSTQERPDHRPPQPQFSHL